MAAANLAGLSAVRPPVEPPEVMELTNEELLEKLSSDPDIPANSLEEFKRALEAFLRDPVNTLDVKDTYEYCINTDGLYVEANVSKCSACDEATIELRKLDVEKARVELELRKRDLRDLKEKKG